MFSQHLAGHTYSFASLTEVMAKASPIRSGDQLAGCAANSAAERVAAAMVLADVELNEFLRRPLIDDTVTDLIHRTHDSDAFRPLAHMTVGAFREYLLEQAYRGADISSLAWGLTPEMAAAVSKLMSNGELIAVSAALSVVTKFRTTLGLPGRLSSRLQPNHPTDDPPGVAASVLDGLLFGCGDAVVGINPAGDSPEAVRDLLLLLDEVRRRYSIPMQSSVLTHISTTIDLMEADAPVDLPFQSIAGTEGTLRSFGVSLDMLAEAEQAANELRRGTVGTNALYFETGQGSCLSAGANIGVDGPVDQQTLEARAYGVARAYRPLLVNTVVGFIGPEYLYDGKQIIRAGLEDNFCGRLLGIQMGCDVCYTNHAETDSDDMDTLLHLLAAANTGFVIAVPGADDIMLGYQSLSFHDIAQVRATMGKQPAPEFEEWLHTTGVTDRGGLLADEGPAPALSPDHAMELGWTS